MSFERFLSDQEVAAVHKALIDADLASPSAQDAMLASLLPAYRNILPRSNQPAVQLSTLLSLMNQVHNLRSGDVPLAQFLGKATTLAAGTTAQDVLDRALQRIHNAGAASPAAPAAAIAAVDSGAGGGGELNTAVTLEATTNAYDMTRPVSFLRKGVAAAESVMKLLVHRHMDGHAEYLAGEVPWLSSGTGWMIGPGLVITNHHVVNARSVDEPDADEKDFLLQAENTEILFDYVAKDVPASATVVTGKGALVHSDPALDFAILRLSGTAPSRKPLRLRSHAIRKTAIQALGIGVNLLQHPNGDPMRLGFRNNYVVLGDDTQLSYLTDTDVGSSGSPACDDDWMVAALHRESSPIGEMNIEILGHKYRRVNRGTQITAIMAHLRAAQLALHDEIATGQG